MRNDRTFNKSNTNRGIVMKVMSGVAYGTRPVIRVLELIGPVIDLAIRLWVASVFWVSGMTKLESWEGTVMLFTYEYNVRLLPPELAIGLAIFVELVFSALLALGLGARIAAFVLFVFNLVAVMFYPAQIVAVMFAPEVSEIGVRDHLYWGLLLLVTLFHGPGKLSLDYLIRRKWMRR